MNLLPPGGGGETLRLLLHELLLPPGGESIESLDVDAPDAVASGKETAGGSSKVGSDVCVVPDPLPTAVSVRTVVAEEWMDWFV